MGNDIISKFDVPYGIVVFKLDNTLIIEKANAKFCDVAGFTFDELKQQDVLELFEEDCRNSFCEFFHKCSVGDNTREKEINVKLISHGEKLIWARVTCASVNVEENWIALIFDYNVQKEKQLEQQVELFRNRYRMMQEVSEEIPFDLDVAEWKLLCSKRFMEARGVKDAEDTYYPFAEGVKEIHPLDQERFTTAMKVAAGKEMSGTIDTRYNVAQDNMVPKYIWYRTHYKSVRGNDGKIIRIIGRSYNVEKDVLLEEK